MTVEHYADFFNDVFGPIMQPGSSSHTAAPCRLGYLARNLLGEPPKRVHVLVDREGSFAGSFGLIAEDKAWPARWVCCLTTSALVRGDCQWKGTLS